MKTIKLKITGKVQGVWFRATSKEVADRLGLTGWARNESDGSVVAVVQGEEAGLEEFKDWCHEGPRGAFVEDVKINEEASEALYETFEVRH